MDGHLFCLLYILYPQTRETCLRARRDDSSRKLRCIAREKGKGLNVKGVGGVRPFGFCPQSSVVSLRRRRCRASRSPLRPRGSNAMESATFGESSPEQPRRWARRPVARPLPWECRAARSRRACRARSSEEVQEPRSGTMLPRG